MLQAMPNIISTFALALTLGLAHTALAQAAAPYSAPFQLRGAVAGNALRSETAFGFSDGADAVASYLSVSYKLMPDVAGVARVGVASASPASGVGGTALMNPQLGVLWSPKLGESFRLSPFLGVTLPVGMGGGETPTPEVSAALAAARQSRFGLDSGIALPNHLWMTGGVSAAWIAHGVTLQAEATLHQGVKTRGASTVDEAITNTVSGVFAGYSVIPQLNVGAELRYQHFLSTPASVAKTPELRGQLSFAAGARGHFKVGELTLRPALSYGRALGGVAGDASVHAVIFDMALAF